MEIQSHRRSLPASVTPSALPTQTTIRSVRARKSLAGVSVLSLSCQLTPVHWMLGFLWHELHPETENRHDANYDDRGRYMAAGGQPGRNRKSRCFPILRRGSKGCVAARPHEPPNENSDKSP